MKSHSETHRHILKKLLTLALITLMTVLFMLPKAAATNYSDGWISDIAKDEAGNITSVTVQFTTGSTWSSNWFLAINNDTDDFTGSATGSDRVVYPGSANNKDGAIDSMKNSGMEVLASGELYESSNGVHVMTLLCDTPVANNSAYKLRLWIHYGGWVCDMEWNLSEMVEVYDTSYICNISGGTGVSNGFSQTVTKGSPITTRTITAVDGYYFAENYTWAQNGLTATRLSETQISISGTPTANTVAALPGATAKPRLTNVIMTPNPDILYFGQQLTVSAAPQDAEYTVVWRRGYYGPELGTGNSYTTTAADVGSRICAVVTAIDPYYGTTNVYTKSLVTAHTFEVDYNLSYLNTSNTDDATDAAAYTTNLTPIAGYQVPDATDVSVIIGNTTLSSGSDYTYTKYSSYGQLTIPAEKLTGDVSITAQALPTPPPPEPMTLNARAGTLYARNWTRDGALYQKVITADEVLPIPSPPANGELISFAGWYSDYSFDESTRVSTVTVGETRTLYAKWVYTNTSYKSSDMYYKYLGTTADVRGYDNSFIRTTYSDRGYQSYYKLGELEAGNTSGDFYSGNKLTFNKALGRDIFTRIGNTNLYAAQVMSVQGNYVAINYIVENRGSSTYTGTLNIGAAADVMIASNDFATVIRTSAAGTEYLTMSEGGSGKAFRLYIKGESLGVTDVDRYWVGGYYRNLNYNGEMYTENVFNDTSMNNNAHDKSFLSGKDSALSYSWALSNILPGSTTIKTVKLGVGTAAEMTASKTIIADAAGGAFDDNSSVMLISGESITVKDNGSIAVDVKSIPAPVRTGYRFVNWVVGSSQVQVGMGIADGTTITATWEALNKNVTNDSVVRSGITHADEVVSTASIWIKYGDGLADTINQGDTAENIVSPNGDFTADFYISNGYLLPESVTVMSGAMQLTEGTGYTYTLWGTQRNARLVIKSEHLTEHITIRAIGHPEPADAPENFSVTVSPTSVTFGSTATLTATVSPLEGHTFSYKWYESSTDINQGGTEIAGATSAEYTVTNSAVGSHYYYCRVTATRIINGQTAEAVSNTADMTVNKIDLSGSSVSITGWRYGQTANEPTFTKVPESALIPDGYLIYEYYTDSACTMLTDIQANGAPVKGDVPTEPGVYYVKAKIQESDEIEGFETPAAMFEITPELYNVTHTLANLTAAAGTAGTEKATQNADYVTTLFANEHYILPESITVTVGGTALTNTGTTPDYTYVSAGADAGKITILAKKVRGDIVITAAGLPGPCDVTYTLKNLIAGGAEGADKAFYLTDYETKLIAANGYNLPAEIDVSVSGSWLISGSGYTYSQSSGEIHIPAENVTGDIVITASSAPEITKHPDDIETTEGVWTSFYVEASGSGLTYQWQVYSGSEWENIGFAESQLFELQAGCGDEQYRCVVTDAAGMTAVSNVARLYGNTEPNVVMSHSSITIMEGETASFNARGFDGTQPLTYSWNTNPVRSGNSLDVTPTQTTTYTVTVTDAANVTCTGSITVTVIPRTYTITASPDEKIFEEATVGYARPSVQTVTVQNTGNSPVSLTLPASGDGFVIDTSRTATSLASGAQTTLTVVPETGLTAGVYSKTLIVETDKGTSAQIAVSFTVNPLPSVAINGSSTVAQGSGETLNATVTGGTGPFVYKWSLNGLDMGAGTPTLTTDTALAVGTYIYKVSVTDKNGKIAFDELELTVSPRSYAITITPTIDFGMITQSAALPLAQTVTVTNTGNQNVTLSQPTSTDFVIGALSKTTLAPDEAAFFTVRPGDLNAGTYNESIRVTANVGTVGENTVETGIHYTVNPAIRVSVSGEQSITAGQSTTLTANAGGGKAPYTYLWNTGEAGNSITVSPRSTAAYTVTVEDAFGGRATAAVTVSVTAQQRPIATPDDTPPDLPDDTGEPDATHDLELVPAQNIEDSTIRENAEKENADAAPFDYGEGQIIIIISSHDGIVSAGLPNEKSVIEAVLSSAELDSAANGETVEIRLDVTFVGDELPAEDRAVMESVSKDFEKTTPGFTLGAYVDISLQKRINGGEWIPISESGNPLEVRIAIPEKLLTANTEYYVLCSHGGEYALLDDLDNAPDTVTVRTQYFSTCAIAYRATESCFWHWIVLGIAAVYSAFTLIAKDTNKKRRLTLLIGASLVMLLVAAVCMITHGCHVGFLVAAGGILLAIAANVRGFMQKSKSTHTA